jgi:sulfur carrier protein ThiS
MDACGVVRRGDRRPLGAARRWPEVTMHLTFKLYASLTQHLPADARRSNQIPLEVPDGTPIAKIIEPFGLPERLVHLVLVNGVYVPPAERLSYVPKDGDVLAIWPPIAGG